MISMKNITGSDTKLTDDEIWDLKLEHLALYMTENYTQVYIYIYFYIDLFMRMNICIRLYIYLNVDVFTSVSV
jgi:hypothetical protein